jgi:hypothetical protein
LRYTLDDDFRTAHCRVEVTVDGADDVAVSVALREDDTGAVVAEGHASPRSPLEFTLGRPRLWSPRRPHLYTLSATLEGDDTLTERVAHLQRVQPPPRLRNPRRRAPPVEILLKSPARDETWQPVELRAAAEDQSVLERVVDDMRRAYHRYDSSIVRTGVSLAPARSANSKR